MSIAVLEEDFKVADRVMTVGLTTLRVAIADAIAAERERFTKLVERYPIEFADTNGCSGKLKMRNGAWFFDGAISK